MRARSRKNDGCRRLAVGVVAAAVAATSSVAAEVPAHPEAQVTIEPDAVRFLARGELSELTLAVRGPDGKVVRRSVVGRSEISFSTDARPQDGRYDYELRGITASGEVRRLSGSFSARSGGFVVPTEEPPTQASPDEPDDQVFFDDLIVEGSACIGDDCDNGESFGFVTLGMEENNLRIEFSDSSNAAGFPRTQWQLEANDDFEGGAEHFAIVDCGDGNNVSDCPRDVAVFKVEAEAPVDSLRIDSEGRVGLGTALPESRLHVVGGDTPSLRLEQDTTGGLDAYVWTLGTDGLRLFVEDVTGGGVRPLGVLPGAADDTLTLAPAGVGIGTSEPAVALDVRGDVAVTGSVDGRDVGDDGATLDAHLTDFTNPHAVTAAQTGADSAGTAAAVLTNHEAAFDHTALPSSLPVPISEGGTGADNPEEARAGLGVPELQVGILTAADFTEDPTTGLLTATVVLSTPTPDGSQTVVGLTPVLTGTVPVTVNLGAVGTDSFTVFASDGVGDVHWMVQSIPLPSLAVSLDSACLGACPAPTVMSRLTGENRLSGDAELRVRVLPDDLELLTETVAPGAFELHRELLLPVACPATVTLEAQLVDPIEGTASSPSISEVETLVISMGAH